MCEIEKHKGIQYISHFPHQTVHTVQPQPPWMALPARRQCRQGPNTSQPVEETLQDRAHSPTSQRNNTRQGTLSHQPNKHYKTGHTLPPAKETLQDRAHSPTSQRNTTRQGTLSHQPKKHYKTGHTLPPAK